MKEIFKKKIRLFLQKSGKKPLSYKELLQKCKPKKPEIPEFNAALKELTKNGSLFEKRGGFILSSVSGGFPAVVSRVNKTFGFIKRDDDSTDVFIPGKYLRGAMPGDKVLAKLIPSRTGSPEGEVLRIVEENHSQFTGVVVTLDGQKFIQPDSFTKAPIAVEKDGTSYSDGEKVMAEIATRGERHSDHTAKITSSFGMASRASVCAQSVLEVNGIPLEFPFEVIDEAKRVAKIGIPQNEINRRTDLRSDVIFTIDGADTKDIDDAISIRKFESFYELGVHIADVSFYVKPNSALDKDSFERGTSVYYANRVVPMLPKELSNGICSLNPQEDRLAFSCIMTIGLDGKLQDFDFKKTVICSRVKGVYSEINQLLAGNSTDELNEKYAACMDSIRFMRELADILAENRKRRGSPQLETTESKLIISDEDICVDVKPRERGESERIIEEFMLMANQSAATLGRLQNIPFVYRVHEDPSPEKIQSLHEIMEILGIPLPEFLKIKPKHLAEILDKERTSKLFPMVNKMILRSMAKAKYSAEPLGHFGLVLEDYTHFTSPIRRYPDLAIHRILSDFIQGGSQESIKRRYSAFAQAAANHSTEMELVAMRIEMDCEDCYKAEYMNAHIGESFAGVISSVTEFGFYVELPNTVEGLVRIDSLPSAYDFDGHISLRPVTGGKSFTIGDEVTVTCVKAEVSSGKIDFQLAESTN